MKKNLLGVLDIGDLSLKYMALENKTPFRVLEAGMEEIDIFALHKAGSTLTNVVKQKGFTGIPIVISFPSGICRAKVCRVEFHRQTKGVIDAQEEHRMQRHMTEIASGELREHLSKQMDIMQEDFTELRMIPLRFYLNGYEVSCLSGKNGETAEADFLGIFLLNSHMPLFRKMREMIGESRFFVSHEAEALHVFAKKEQKGRIVIDVGEYSCSIAVTSPLGLVQIGFVGEGGSAITHALEQEFGLRENTARELKLRYMQRDISEEARSRVQTIVVPHVRRLVGLLKKELETMDISLPPVVSLVGGDALLPEIREELEERGGFDGLPLAGESVVASILTPKDLGISTTFPRKLDPIFTPPILLSHAK
ncbi:MAG: hypothetical protein Q8P71_00915 [bacterium]|nr:hypothetical protein [bacterium]